MSRFIIVGNGNIDDHEIFKKAIRKNDLLIAADGGFNHFKKLALKPSYIIGDMDSIKNLSENDHSIKILKYSRKKDKTDTELAIEFALKNKASEILFFGMTSQSRMDHSINNIFLLERLAKKGIVNILYANSYTRISAVKKYVKLYKKDGCLVSLIPLSQKIKGITTKGLEYKLKKESLFRDKARGISNIITEEEAEIKFGEGMLLLVQIND